MHAEINKEGELTVYPGSVTDCYALEKWSEKFETGEILFGRIVNNARIKIITDNDRRIGI